MEDIGPLVNLYALGLTDVPIALGATYQYGGRGGSKDTATVGEEGGDVGIVQESRVKTTDSLPVKRQSASHSEARGGSLPQKCHTNRQYKVILFGY